MNDIILTFYINTEKKDEIVICSNIPFPNRVHSSIIINFESNSVRITTIVGKYRKFNFSSFRFLVKLEEYEFLFSKYNNVLNALKNYCEKNKKYENIEKNIITFSFVIKYLEKKYGGNNDC